MRKATLIFIICLALGCSKTKPGWKTIDLDEYAIDVPDYFNLKFEKGIDSQPGFLKGRDFDIAFDYGMYCDTLVLSPQEYIQSRFWLDRSFYSFADMRKYFNVDDRQIKITTIRTCTKSDSSFAGGCDFIAACVYKKNKFNLPGFIPQEVKNHIVKLDTIQRHYRRLILPKKGIKGITGIYMRKQEAHFFSDLRENAIVMEAKNLTAQQQILAKEIFLTLRPKIKDK